MLVETIIQINVKPLPIELPLSYYWKHFLRAFCIYIFQPVKVVSRRSENVFFHKSFIPACGIRIFV